MSPLLVDQAEYVVQTEEETVVECKGPGLVFQACPEVEFGKLVDVRPAHFSISVPRDLEVGSQVEAKIFMDKTLRPHISEKELVVKCVCEDGGSKESLPALVSEIEEKPYSFKPAKAMLKGARSSELCECFVVWFIPVEVGRHQLSVKVLGVASIDSPVYFDTFAPEVD